MAARRGPGRVILLNGASSSGKSTLAVALQEALDEPFLYVSSDHFVSAGMLPRRVDYGGSSGSQGSREVSAREAFSASAGAREVSPSGSGASRGAALSGSGGSPAVSPSGSGSARGESRREAFDWWHEMRPRFFAGFHACLPAFAWAGNDLIVEHIIEIPAWRKDLAYQLAGLDVYLVGVHCAPHEIDRRERERGNRRIGEGRTHVTADAIHSFGPYDLDVDTTAGVSPELVAAILRAWEHRAAPSAL